MSFAGVIGRIGNVVAARCFAYRSSFKATVKYISVVKAGEAVGLAPELDVRDGAQVE